MTASLADITSVIRAVLRNDSIELGTDSRFEDLDGWDSMDLVSVVVEVECRFDLQFALFELDRLDTVGDLIRMTETKRALDAV